MGSEHAGATLDMVSADTIGSFLAAWLATDALEEPYRTTFHEYYSSYLALFDDYIRRHYSFQTNDLMRILDEFERPRVLEIGCGCGTETLWMALRARAVVHGIDVKADRLRVGDARRQILEEACGHKLDCTFALTSLHDLPAESTYDVIWMEQTIHHLEPRARALDAIAALLRPGGYVVIADANAWSPFNQLLAFRVRGFRTIGSHTAEDGRTHHYGIERILTPRTLVREFARRAVEKESVTYYRMLPNRQWARALEPCERILPQWLVPVFSHYNYVGRKPA
jgi:SAM-dependent methyltransferase